MNNKHFQDIVKGVYGRKIAYADVDVITPGNVVEVVEECESVFRWNLPAIRYLWNYYKGDQPVRYRTKTGREDIRNVVLENHSYEIVQFKTGQTYGEPVQYISRRDDERVNKAVDELNDYMVDANKQEKDIKSGEWQSAVGTSFKAIQNKDGDIPFRIVAPSPLNTYVIYSRVTEEPLLAVQELKEGSGEKICFSENMEFMIKKGELVYSKLHAFGDIPIVEYPNNAERISDIELVIDLLDAINNMQSNRMDAIEQFVQSWIRFVNCEIDEEQFAKMKEMGALVVKSNNGENKASVDIMTQELNQSESQVAKEDLWDNALSVLGMPNKQVSSSGDSQGAVELRNGWDFSKSRGKMKDAFVATSEKRLAKIALNVLRVSGNDLGITMRDFDVTISHSPQDNLSVKAMSLGYLLQNGVHPRIAIDTCGLWSDAEKVFLQSQPYLDHLWKTVDDEQGEAVELETQNYGFGTSQTGQAQREATNGLQ